ncbi:MAG: RcnB family protein [Rubrivivax sp.]
MTHFRRLGIILLALSMGFGSLASAQGRDRDRRDDRRDDRHQRDDRGYRADRGDRHDADRGRAYRDGRRGDQGYNNRGEARDRHGDWRGAGPRHDFRRGGYLPREYRSRQYVVDNWRLHHLYAPPRGYHWVQTGGDYVLAAIATGVILQILLNN